MNATFHRAILATIPSESRPGLVHHIHMGADGNVWCDCEHWKYQRKPATERTCKHLQAFATRANLPNVALLRQMLATMQTMVAPPAPKPAPPAPKTARRPNPWTTPLPA